MQSLILSNEQVSLSDTNSIWIGESFVTAEIHSSLSQWIIQLQLKLVSSVVQPIDIWIGEYFGHNQNLVLCRSRNKNLKNW